MIQKNKNKIVFSKHEICIGTSDHLFTNFSKSRIKSARTTANSSTRKRKAKNSKSTASLTRLSSRNNIRIKGRVLRNKYKNEAKERVIKDKESENISLKNS